MRIHFLFSMALLSLLVACKDTSEPREEQRAPFDPITVHYPETYRDTTTLDTFYNLILPDPYRWLELEGTRLVDSWLQGQEQVVEHYFDNITFGKEVAASLKKYWDYPRISTPISRGEQLFFFRNEGLQNADIFYRQSGTDGLPEQILPFQLQAKASEGIFEEMAVSKDGQHIALLFSYADQPWEEIRVLSITQGAFLPDTIRWVKHANMAWAGNGFYYSRYPAATSLQDASTIGEFHAVYYHELGTAASEDVFAFADRSKPGSQFRVFTTPDEQFLVVRAYNKGLTSLFAKDLSSANAAFTPLVMDSPATFDLVGNLGKNLLFRTNDSADKGRLIQINTQKPDPGFWETILPETKELLVAVAMTGGHLLTHHLAEGSSRLAIHSLSGELEATLDLPSGGTASHIEARPDRSISYFTFESISQPPTVYRLDVDRFETTVFKEVASPLREEITVSSKVAESYDNTDIPVFIAHRADLKLDGQQPTLLYVQSGEGKITSPVYHPQLACWMKQGGIVAIANIRGSAALGTSWYEAGIQVRKQTALDDLQLVAEFLIAEGYTKKEKLALLGSGVGAMVAGGSVVQRPDLFQAAVLVNGVYDILSLQRLEAGTAWEREFGPVEDAQAFDYLNAYAPYQNTVPGTYPALYLMTGPNPAYSPAHSYKFAARLQQQQKAELPILMDAGRMVGDDRRFSLNQQIQVDADQLTFIFHQLKVPLIETELLTD